MPDQPLIRRDLMKAELKMIVSDLAEKMIERWKPSMIPLLRASMEFCLQLEDVHFLFTDLFQLFSRDLSLYEIFLAELEPFIVAGMFRDWELPEDVLADSILNAYKFGYSDSTPGGPGRSLQQLEQIIINLNFTNYPNSGKLALIYFCQEQKLFGAMLFLYSSVYERKEQTSCIEMFFALSNIYKEAESLGKEETAMLRVRPAELLQLADDSEERARIEVSKEYVGYKLLWCLDLFL